MADDSRQTTESSADSRAAAAGRVLENLAELEPELRGAAIFSLDAIAGQSTLLASTPDDSAWAGAAAELLASVELAATRPESETAVDSAHIALAEGEVFIVREAGHALVASTGRFVLASLTAYDMRMALRDLVATGGEKQC